jgi:carboxypeptidase C (cathepsin A)
MIREPGRPARLADNPFSPLDAMDLVFIDPVGTGYTRVLGGADGAPYWDVMGDAQAVIEIIQDWLRANGRENSPKFVLGESYGGARLAAMLKLGGVRFNGALMFVGALLNEADDNLPYMLMLPSMAAIARFHGLTAAPGSTTEVFDAAYQYALRDYALALLQGADLAGAERDAVAARLSGLIGLPVETIVAKNLRIDVEFYVRELLKSRGLRIGRLDGRVTGPLDAPAARPPYDDPSMKQRSVGGATYEDYFGGELGFRSATTYNSLNLDINAVWTFGPRRGPRPDFARFIGEAMAAAPALRLYSAAGYFDLGVPVAGARYALSHGGIPRERVTFRYYETGHTLFDTDQNLQRVSSDVCAFVRGEG